MILQFFFTRSHELSKHMSPASYWIGLRSKALTPLALQRSPEERQEILMDNSSPFALFSYFLNLQTVYLLISSLEKNLLVSMLWAETVAQTRVFLPLRLSGIWHHGVESRWTDSFWGGSEALLKVPVVAIAQLWECVKPRKLCLWVRDTLVPKEAKLFTANYLFLLYPTVTLVPYLSSQSFTVFIYCFFFHDNEKWGTEKKNDFSAWHQELMTEHRQKSPSSLPSTSSFCYTAPGAEHTSWRQVLMQLFLCHPPSLSHLLCTFSSTPPLLKIKIVF